MWGTETNLRAYASGVAIGAIDLGHVAEIDRVLKLHAFRRSLYFFSILRLRQQGVAGIAVLADDLAILAHVVAVMAAKTTLEIEVADIVRMGLPAHLHLRKDAAAEDALEFGDHCLNLRLFGFRDVRVLFVVESGDFRGDRLHRFVGGLVVGGQYLDSLGFGERERSVDTVRSQRLIDGAVGRHVNMSGTVVAVHASHTLGLQLCKSSLR